MFILFYIFLGGVISLEFKFEQKSVLEAINRKKNKDIALLVVSLIISTIVTCLYGIKLTTIYFYFLSLLTLPLILNGVNDLKNMKENKNLKLIEGEIIDLFPQKEGDENGAWIIFIKKDNSKKFDSFELISKPGDFQINDKVKLSYTENLKIPVLINKL